MKNFCIIAAIAATCGIASAITVNVPSSLTGTDALNGQNAYAWGIPISLAAGQNITGASLAFTDIKLTAANSTGKGVLYSDLINSSLTGVHTYTDNDAVGDYFTGHYSGGNIVSLGSKVFASVGTMLSWTVTFNSSQLQALNSFLVNGIFNIGFDPDCHYNVGCISFNYTVSPPPVSTPDTATTAYVLGLALLALEVTRRKLAMAKK